MPWEYSPATKRYRDQASGRFLSNAAMVRLRDQFASAMEERGKALTQRLAEGERTLSQWQADQRKALKATYIDQYVMGRGGRQQMTQSDWGRLGQLLRTQYQHLQGFAADLAAGTLTPAQAGARGSLYYASSTQAYEAGRAAAWGISLPAYPGDGSSECGANCKCRWDIRETDTEIEATWETRPAEHCATCVSRAATWNPLVFPKPAAVPTASSGTVAAKHLASHDERTHGRRRGGHGGGSGLEGPDETPTPSKRSILAKQTSRRVDAEVQRYSEEHCEPILARGLKGGGVNALSLRDNEPADVVTTRAGKIEHGIELKTMTDNKNGKLTMKRDAMERKAAWMKENGADFHTVVFDDQKVFNAKGAGRHDDAERVILYRRGYGSFRTAGMHRVKDMDELRALLDMPGADLPAAARAPAGYQGFKSVTFAPVSR